MSDIIGNNEPLQKVVCNSCRHYRRNKPATCTAFPKGIPLEIITGKNDHTKLYPGQKNNILYESNY